ncbi:hypothetical protein A3860_39090 [Niastella vici]|uniref:Uncharacterized protein n=1 Tax=Niastella vici TaxID=1703345 RepID=A0A1V9FKY6_9BACT|nr:hypothetical protein [Niastella vici]OQP58941.1 hypothetical protein A3860_39090 [Niastella vici]
MNEAHIQFQEVFDELYALTIHKKMKFLEALMFYFTITSRGIWSDDKPSDAEKVEAFKWLNELSHRIWNLQFELQRGEDSDSIIRLYENMKFYGEQSGLLRSHLLPTILAAFENFKARM